MFPPHTRDRRTSREETVDRPQVASEVRVQVDRRRGHVKRPRLGFVRIRGQNRRPRRDSLAQDARERSSVRDDLPTIEIRMRSVPAFSKAVDGDFRARTSSIAGDDGVLAGDVGQRVPPSFPRWGMDGPRAASWWVVRQRRRVRDPTHRGRNVHEGADVRSCAPRCDGENYGRHRSNERENADRIGRTHRRNDGEQGQDREGKRSGGFVTRR